MKSIIVSIVCFLVMSNLLAQTDKNKLMTDTRKIAGDWQSDFKNLRGATRSDSEHELVFYSRMKICGSRDSSNFIHYIKDRGLWFYTADFDRDSMPLSTLDSLIREIVFSFGKLKPVKTNVSYNHAYVPENKKGASEKLRCFFFLVSDLQKDPQDNSGQAMRLTIGNDDYFRSK